MKYLTHQYAGSSAMRISSIETKVRPRTNRKNIFLRILVALHASRRREARRVLRHYSHLIEQYSRTATASIAPDSKHTEESPRNAHANTSPNRSDDGTRRNAAGHAAQDQFA
jgi:hypothetical protein